MDRGEAAERGGERAGLDGFGVLAAGLAQVRVQVDQPGQQHHPGTVEGLFGGQSCTDGVDSPVRDPDVYRLALAVQKNAL